MSIRAHGERTVVVTGLPMARVGETGRLLARRLRRPLVDLPQELAKRRWPVFKAHSDSALPDLSAADRLLQEAITVERRVVAAECQYLADSASLRQLRHRTFIVMVDYPLEYLWERLQSASPPVAQDQAQALGQWSEWRRGCLDCDLQLHGRLLSPLMASRLIVHCVYG